jgi:hypothetical protein
LFFQVVCSPVASLIASSPIFLGCKKGTCIVLLPAVPLFVRFLPLSAGRKIFPWTIVVFSSYVDLLGFLASGRRGFRVQAVSK